MIIIFAKNLPPAVRGRMKIWFFEPRANVFVSGIQDKTAKEVVEYLSSHCLPDSEILIFYSIPEPPGFEMKSLGVALRPRIQITGLTLFAKEKR